MRRHCSPGVVARLTLVAVGATMGSIGLMSSAHAQPVESSTPPAVVSRDWSATLRGSLRLLTFEHAIRIAAEPKTRRQLGGPLWDDYRRSVRWPRQWSDGDGWQVNYVGHPVHGAAAARIWLEQEPLEPSVGLTRAYFRSRAQAALFAGAYSLQFEFGPMSEASIGNVGLNPETAGWTDVVMTPMGALGVLFGEDLAARYVLPWVERRTSNRMIRSIARMTLNPAKGMANVAQQRVPWR